MAIPLIPAAASCILLALAVYRYIIHPEFLSPLAKVPNAHWTAPFTSAWILYYRLIQKDTPTVHAAHQKLGPIIRLGPEEISVNCVDGGIRTIYGGGYEKGDWYANIFTNYGVQPMFAMPEHGRHSRRKRMLSNVYAKSTLQGSETVAAISKAVLNERLVPRLKAIAASGKPIEVYDIFSSATMDFVAAYAFGLKNGSNFIREPAYATKFLRDYKARQMYTFWPQEMPNFTAFMKRVGLIGWIVPSWVGKANQDIEAWIMAMCDRAEASLRLDSIAPANYPTVYAQLRSGLLKEATKTDIGSRVEDIVKAHRLEMASEMIDHVLAGFDTSSITLTWLAWELSRPANARWQQQLLAEISGLQDRKDPKQVDSLPALNAILMETLRIHAAIPGQQPRVTPPSAALGQSEAIIAGLPAGLRVQSQAWSLHRNPDVFPDPDAWKPERWLESSEAQLREMGRWFWAFGSGGRMCVGSNLAILEIKAIMIAVWGSYRSTVADDSGMVHNGGYLAEPIGEDGKFLVLGFEHIE